MKCTDSGAELAPGARFCIQCGVRAARTCSGCEVQLPNEAAFCPSCGQVVRILSQPSATPDRASVRLAGGQSRAPRLDSRQRSPGGKKLVIGVLIGIPIGILVICILSYVWLVQSRDSPDWRLAEAKALAGSTMTKLSACLQAKGAGQTCVLREVAVEIGVDPSDFKTKDGRWQITAASMTVSSDAKPTLSGQISISGISGPEASMALTMFVNASSGVVLRCNVNDRRPPSVVTDGKDC